MSKPSSPRPQSPFNRSQSGSFLSDSATQQIYLCDKTEAEYLAELKKQQEVLQKYQKEYQDFMYDSASGELKKGFIRRKYKDGSVYEGQIENKKRHGQGKFIKADSNQTYMGEWRNDKMDGDGILYFENGEYYKGTIINGMKQSYDGFYVYFNGNTYKGEWENDRKDGYGVLHNLGTGEVYKGQWKAGYKEG